MCRLKNWENFNFFWLWKSIQEMGYSLKRGWFINLFSKNTQIGTRVWWARVLHNVPEPTKLGYPSVFSYWKEFKIPRLVPEPTKLGYQSGYSYWKEGYFISLFSKYLDWYPSPPNSGTNLGILKRGWWISLFSISFNGLVSWWNSTEISESSIELLGKTSESGSTLEWW